MRAYFAMTTTKSNQTMLGEKLIFHISCMWAAVCCCGFLLCSLAFVQLFCVTEKKNWKQLWATHTQSSDFVEQLHASWAHFETHKFNTIRFYFLFEMCVCVCLAFFSPRDSIQRRLFCMPSGKNVNRNFKTQLKNSIKPLTAYIFKLLLTHTRRIMDKNTFISFNSHV